MRFFFDACVSVRIARAIAVLEEGEGKHDVVHHDQRWPAGTKDPYWIRELGKEGNWIILSVDHGILTNPDNRQVWKESKLTTFFFSKTFAKNAGWPQVIEVISYWPEIKLQAKNVPRGTVLSLPWHSNAAIIKARPS